MASRTVRSLLAAATVAALAAMSPVLATASGAAKAPTCRTCDTTAPTVAISTPAAGATVSGTVSVTGTASDNVSVAKVEFTADGSTWIQVSGTTSWSYSWSTAGLPTGSRIISVRSTDTSKNVSTTVSRQVYIGLSGTDTTPPTISISSPGSGAVVSGTVYVNGYASDNSGQTDIWARVDNQTTWQHVTKNSSWGWAWLSNYAANGYHTIYVKAVDPSGNTTVASVQIISNNPCSDGASVVQQATTTEGVVIRICTSVGSWTTDAINTLLKASARDLTTVGPTTLIEVGTAKATTETTGSTINNYKASIYLNPSSGSQFASTPDAVVAHEYGHAWTNYWLYNNPANNQSWDSYLKARGIYGDSRIGSSYAWTTTEMAADDYRRLFGSALAQSQLPYINSAIPDSQQVSGLSTFFTGTWA
jgi:hypothetical protein